MPLVVFAFDPADTDLVSGAGAAQLPPQHAAEALGEKSCGSPVGTAWSPGISVAAIGLGISSRISKTAPVKQARRHRQQAGQATERHRASGAQDSNLFAGRLCSIEPIAGRCLRLVDGLEAADEFANVVFLTGRRKDQRSSAPVSLVLVVVFFIVFSAPTPTVLSSTPRRTFGDA